LLANDLGMIQILS